MRACLKLGVSAMLLCLALAPLAPLGPLADEAAANPPRPRATRPARGKRPTPTPAKPEPTPTTPAEAPSEPVLQRSNRMELDARVVRGETARSGAVYLFQRAPRRLPPLVGLQQSYLADIVVPVLGPDALAPAAADAGASPAPGTPGTPAAPGTPGTPPTPPTPGGR